MKVFNSLNNSLVWISYVSLALMVIIVFIDVFLRYFLNSPLKGAYELVLLAMTLAGGFAILYTAMQKGHVGVDILSNRLPRRVQLVLQVFASALGLITWGMVAYWTFVGGVRLLRYGQVTDSLHIKTGPFQLALAVGLSLCCIVLLIQAFHPAVEAKSEDEEEPST